MAREKLADTNLSISGYTPVWRDIMQGYAVLDPVPLRGKIIRRNVCTAVASTMTTTKKKLASIAISVQPRCFHTLTHLASPAMMGALTKDFALGD